jgi:methionyl-tRNA formyltransferase
MTPWPGAFTTFPDGNVPKTFKVLATRRSELTSGGAPPGTVIEAGKNRVVVACGEGCVEIVRGQLEGKKPLGASELVGGRTLTSGMRLGEGA